VVVTQTPSRPSIVPRKAKGRSKPTGLLNPLLPFVGRQAAGAETAAKRKRAVRETIENALTVLERADLAAKPDLRQVAAAAGVSFTTVWRHCQSDPQLAARLHLGHAPPSANGKLAEVTGKLKRAEFVIAEQWVEITKLGDACRMAERKCEILEDRLAAAGLTRAKGYEEPIRSSTVANLRLVSDRQE
jgi:hypothetical protein